MTRPETIITIPQAEYERLCRLAGIAEQLRGFLATCGRRVRRDELREMFERRGERGNWR